MVRTGTVKSLDYKFHSGTIFEESTGTEYLFRIGDCKENRLPKLHTKVSFERDTDFKHTDVAQFVHEEE